MQTYQIPAEVAKAVHEYLMTRPMGEVEQLVNAFRQGKLVAVKEEESVAATGDKEPEA